jgi:hypothetical protein
MASAAAIRVVEAEALAQVVRVVVVLEGWVEARAARVVHSADRKGQTSVTALHSA